MSSTCAECLSYKGDGYADADFPAAWEAVPIHAMVFAPGVPTAVHGKGHLRLCKACDTLWQIGWDPRDGIYEGSRPIPGSSKSMLRSDAPAAQVLRDALLDADLHPVTAAWFEQASTSAADMLQAIAATLAGRQGVPDGRAILLCLEWLLRVLAGKPLAYDILARDERLLQLLLDLPGRPRSVADRLKVPAREIAAGVARIGERLVHAAPAWAARLRALDSPEARCRRAQGELQARLDEPAYPHELVLQALAELFQEGWPLQPPDVDLALRLLAEARATGPGASPAIAGRLFQRLDAGFRDDSLPPSRRVQVLQALGQGAAPVA